MRGRAGASPAAAGSSTATPSRFAALSIGAAAAARASVDASYEATSAAARAADGWAPQRRTDPRAGRRASDAPGKAVADLGLETACAGTSRLTVGGTASFLAVGR